MQLPLEEGDTQTLEMAVDVVLLRSSRPAVPAARWQPPAAGPYAAGPRSGSGARKAPKFQGTSTVVVPGPEKGEVGFQAGRGRALPEAPKQRVDSFRFEDVVSASAFVPKSNASSCSHADSSGLGAPLAAALAEVQPFEGQFDDAE